MWMLASSAPFNVAMFRSLCLSEGASKSVGLGSMDAETTVKMLPSQLLRRWRKAGRILNVANALGKIQAKARYSIWGLVHFLLLL